MKEQAFAAAPPALGRALDGRYRLEAEIGTGGLGVVYRATHEKLAKPVAIKLLHEHFGADAVLRGRFEREAKALAALEHPNIVAVTDYGIADDTPYLVMELLEGETLADRLARGPLSAAEVERLAEGLLRALSFVHARGLVHRDVKPGNVFLQCLPGHGERLKMLDFGLAKFTLPPAEQSGDPTLTRAGSIVGTPAYMSPEQASGETADARSDVYAAGVILLQMVAGRLPFAGDAIEQLRSHLVAPVPRLCELCPQRSARPEFELFIGRALAKRREERFADATEMLGALGAIDKPWFTPSENDNALGLANTLLASGEAVTLAVPSTPSPARGSQATASSAHGGERARSSAHGRARGRGVWRWSVLLALASCATVLWLYASRTREGKKAHVQAAKLMAAAETRAKTVLMAAAEAAQQPPTTAPERAPTLAPGPARSAAASGEDQIAAASGENQTAEATRGEAAAEAEGDESPHESTHAEAEPDDSPPPPNASTKPRAAPHNPWRAPLPKELRGLIGPLRAGARGSERATATLRRYTREHPSDVRGRLLLATLYLNRDWRADALNQYWAAYAIEPSSRGAPEMLPNVLGMVVRGFAVAEAERFIDHVYRGEALPAIERALRVHRQDARAVGRVAALKARILAHLEAARRR